MYNNIQFFYLQKNALLSKNMREKVFLCSVWKKFVEIPGKVAILRLGFFFDGRCCWFFGGNFLASLLFSIFWSQFYSFLSLRASFLSQSDFSKFFFAQFLALNNFLHLFNSQTSIFSLSNTVYFS